MEKTEILVTKNQKGFGIGEFMNGIKTWDSGFVTTDQKKAEAEAENYREYRKSLEAYGKLLTK